MSVGAAKRELFQIDLMMMRRRRSRSRKREEEAVRGELVGAGKCEMDKGVVNHGLQIGVIILSGRRTVV